MGAFRGERVGLVGPNGSGKSTIFRLIVKEEEPDGGQVIIDRGVTIGYFSQDVGEMAGRSVVEETMAGAGEVSEVGHELHALEQAMADPARMDELDALIERFRRGSGALRRARWLRAGGQGARDLGGPRFPSGGRGRRRGKAVGRLEDARGLGAHPADAPGRAPAGRANEPSRHRIHHLARAIFEGLRRRADHHVPRPRFSESLGDEDRGDRRRRADDLLRRLRLLREAARGGRGAAASPVRTAASHARQRAGFHRSLQGARQPRCPGAVARQEARQDREGRATQAAESRRLRFPQAAAFRGRRRTSRGGAQGVRLQGHLRRLRFPDPPRRALVRDGSQRRGQVDAA